jgi:hypothetical protein
MFHVSRLAEEVALSQKEHEKITKNKEIKFVIVELREEKNARNQNNIGHENETLRKA